MCLFFYADATPAAAFIHTLTSPLRMYLECISFNSTFFLLKLNTQIAPPGKWEGDYYFFMFYIYVQPFWVMTDIQVSLRVFKYNTHALVWLSLPFVCPFLLGLAPLAGVTIHK